jgi:hypothetical protein
VRGERLDRRRRHHQDGHHQNRSSQADGRSSKASGTSSHSGCREAIPSGDIPARWPIPRLSLVSRSRRAPSSSRRSGRLRGDPRTSTSSRSHFEGAERPQASSPRNASARLQAIYIAAGPIVTLTASGRPQLEPERGVRASGGSGTCPSWESEVLRLHVPQTRVPSKTYPLRYRPARRFPSRAGHLIADHPTY